MLTVADVITLLLYVCLSGSVGVWSARKSRKANKEDFYLGGRRTNPCVLGISLVSGLSSGISYLGLTSYAYGTVNGFGYVWVVVSYLLAVIPVTTLVTIPFFHRCRSVALAWQITLARLGSEAAS
jgi:Na+/proline symporter